MFTADFFWKLFENTGSVAAYLLYKQFISFKV
ncbi:MAG: YqzL family protein [Dethiobacteria bacterium]